MVRSLFCIRMFLFVDPRRRDGKHASGFYRGIQDREDVNS